MSLLPAAAAPEGLASWRVATMRGALLPAMATAAAAAAAASPSPAAVAIWQALPAAARGVVEREGLLSSAATASPHQSLLQLMPMMATAAASLRRGNGSRRVAMGLLTAATVTSSALTAATAAPRAAAAPAAAAGDARKKAATYSSRPHVNWRSANDGAAAAAAAARAALNKNGPHTTDEEAFTCFLPEAIRGAAATFLLLLRAHWTAVVFLFLVLLWFAVAAWCPIYMLPLLFVPAYVRRRIVHDVQQAREVLVHVEMQHQQRRSQRKQPQADDSENEEEEEWEQQQQQQQQEQVEMHQRPFKQQQQQPQVSEEYHSQELRQRRPLHREFPESEDKREREEKEEEKQQISPTGPQQQQQRQQQEQQQERQQQQQQQQQQRLETSEKKEGDEEPDMKKDVKDATNTWYAARNRGMGFLHAVLASALGLYCLFFDQTIRNDRMRGTSVLSTFDALLLTSYFTWDLTAILGYWKEDSPQWLLHCLVSLLALIHPLIATADEPPMNYYGVALSLFELSTPFLALRYFCIKAAAADPSAPIVGNGPGKRTRVHPAHTKAAAAAEAAAAATAAAKKEDAAGAASAALPAAAAAPAPAAEATAAAAKGGAAASGAARDMRTGAAQEASASANVEGKRGLPARPAPAAGTQSPGCKMTSSCSSTTDADEETAAAAEAANMKRKTAGLGGAAAAGTATPGRNIGAQAAAAARYTKRTAAEEAKAGEREEKATGAAAAEGPPPRIVRIYGAVVSAAFALVFFAVRIVWGNFFLLPEIFLQILSPAAASLPRFKKIFFLCAMPVFAALNSFWMLLIIKLLIKPKK